MRMGSANTYDNALQNLYTRQSELSIQQEKLTSGKNINRPSDDPTGAAQAERAMTRLSRVATDQRALEVKRNSITMAESTLGEATELMQSFRVLVLSAGNPSFSSTDRDTVAQQLTGLRDQLFSLANRTDTNGIPLFGGLGSASVPFTDATTGVTFNGVPGQRASTETTLPGAMDGQAIWMNVASGNGTFNLALGDQSTTTATINAGSLTTDMGVVVPPAVTANYHVQFSVNTDVSPSVTNYKIFDSQNNVVVPALTSPPTSDPVYVEGKTITIPNSGMSFVAQGTPASGDVVNISPSTPKNIFNLLDEAIAGIQSSRTTDVTQTISQALTQIDSSMTKISAARGQAGDWMNRADNITSTQESRTIQLTADKSRAEDMDMVQGYSDFTRINTGYQAALQSYAQVQKLSLFNYIS